MFKHADLPFVSIVIPVKNEKGFIRQCLLSISQLDYPIDRYEVIAVDGMSTDNTIDIATEMGAKVILNKKGSVVAARNAGFNVSKGEIIAFTDADCIIDKNWIRNSIKYFSDEKIAGISGPIVTPINQQLCEKAVDFLFDFSVFFGNSCRERIVKRIKKVNDLPGGNAIYTKRALTEVMPVNENLVTADDVELNACLREHGFQLLKVPDVIISHTRGTTPRKLWIQMYRYAIGRVQVSRRHKGLLTLMHILAGCSIPGGVFLVILSFFIMKKIIFFWFISANFYLFLIFIFSLFLSKSIMLSVVMPFVILVFLISWSIGFCKEFFFPTKNLY